VTTHIYIRTCLITDLNHSRDCRSSWRIHVCVMTPVRDNTYTYGHIWLHTYKSRETAAHHGAFIYVTWLQFVTIYVCIWTCRITNRHDSRDCCFKWRIQTWLQFVTIHKYRTWLITRLEDSRDCSAFCRIHIYDITRICCNESCSYICILSRTGVMPWDFTLSTYLGA